jgi:quercetin dioxygenase-like cupin family protein
MEHIPADHVEWRSQPAEHFTGRAWMGVLSQAEDRTLNAITVMFEPGARTHWHSHPEGQVLYVMSGIGRAGTESGTIVDFSAGDVIYSKPGELHWHGATPESPMSHLSLTTGGATIWEPRPVSAEEYNG